MENIKNNIKPMNLFKFYWIFIRKNITKVILSAVMILVIWPVDIVVTPYLSRIFINKMIQENMNVTASYLLYIGSLIVASKIIAAVLGKFCDALFANFMAILKKDLRQHLFMKIHDHSTSFFETRMAGEIGQKIIGFSDQAESIIGFFLGFFIPLLVSIIITLGITFKFNIFVGFLFFTWILVSFLLSIKFANNSFASSKFYSTVASKLNGQIIDSIFNNLNVKIFGSKNLETKYLEKSNVEEIEAKKKSLYKVFSIRTNLRFINTFFFIIFFIVIFLVKGAGNFPIGDFIFIYGVHDALSGYMSWLGMEGSFVFQNIGISQENLNFLLQPTEIKDIENAKELKNSKGNISIKNLGFAYNDKKVFENFNLSIKAKEKVGLLGKSGSGKSTFIKLLMRFYDVNEGIIEIDGQNIKDLTQDSLRRNISYVTQEPMLFNRSVMDNIRYAKEDATIDEIKEAARKANCDFIEELEEGYETIVGERGSKLSGGQKQRIAIARAILKNAPILILDEATSALDSETEMMIQKSLESLMENKTVIAIAHRLSTISSLDRLIVLSEGKIIEDGTHNELLERKGYYYRLWNMQTNGFISEDIKID